MYVPGAEFRVSRTGSSAVVHCIGEVDINASFAFRDTLDMALDADTRQLVLDFGKLTFIDSTGLSVIFRARRRLEDIGGRIAVAGIQARVVQRLFEVSGAEQLIDVYTTVDDALAARRNN